MPQMVPDHDGENMWRAAGSVAAQCRERWHPRPSETAIRFTGVKEALQERWLHGSFNMILHSSWLNEFLIMQIDIHDKSALSTGVLFRR